MCLDPSEVLDVGQLYLARALELMHNASDRPKLDALASCDGQVGIHFHLLAI